MGCDIHLFFERKSDQGIWEDIDVPPGLLPDERNYDLFSFLAGVRLVDNSLHNQFGGRGIPKDSSCYNFFNCSHYENDFFGKTHMYWDEVLKAPWKESGLEECYFRIFCVYVLPRIISTYGHLGPLEERNVRVVIGFDN